MKDKWNARRTNLTRQKIITSGEHIYVKPYRQPMNIEYKIEEAIQNLFENGIPYGFVFRKGTKGHKNMFGFQKIECSSKGQAFPMPNVDEMPVKLNGAKYFSLINYGNEYYQLELEEESQEKSVFLTKHGQFQEMMTKVVRGINGAMFYLDDNLIFTNNKDQHYEVISRVLIEIMKTGLRINPERFQVLQSEIKFLEHIINRNGVRSNSV